MTNRTHIITLVGGGAAGLALGLGLLAGPAWRERAAAHAERADLDVRMAGLTDQTAAVTRLAEELAERRDTLRTSLKEIPDSPDVAAIMRQLSLPADGATVLDQTFTAGTAGDAVVGTPGPEQVVPLTVDVRARFDSVFALMLAAESMDRLVRVASVRMAVDPEYADEEAPIVTASIGLEVVYAAVDPEEH